MASGIFFQISKIEATGGAGRWRIRATFVFGGDFFLNLCRAPDTRMERGGEWSAVQLQEQSTSQPDERVGGEGASG